MAIRVHAQQKSTGEPWRASNDLNGDHLVHREFTSRNLPRTHDVHAILAECRQDVAGYPVSEGKRFGLPAAAGLLQRECRRYGS